MKHKSDDELAALGWKYVARDDDGLAVAFTSDDGDSIDATILGWVKDDGYTVRKIG